MVLVLSSMKLNNCEMRVVQRGAGGGRIRLTCIVDSVAHSGSHNVDCQQHPDVKLAQRGQGTGGKQ